MQYTDPNKRPKPVKPKLDTVPSDLKNTPHWILWRYVWKVSEGVWSKVPFQPDGTHAKSNDKTTWHTFESCFLAFEQQENRFDGLGFVFSETSDFVGVDLDACLSKEKELTPFALRVLEKLYTYTEVSPSRTGIHLIGKAKDIQALKTKYRGNDIEVYRTGRYFTFTGLSFQPQLPVRDIHTDLTEIIEAVKPKEKETENVKPVATVVSLDNNARLQMALKRDNVRRWFGGDTSDFGGDDSRADMALCRSLAFYSDGNRDTLDWMFRQSKLMRPKWDEKRGVDTYGNLTLDKILSTQTEYASFAKVKEQNASSYESRKSRRISVNDVWDSVMSYRASGDSRGVTVGWDNLNQFYRPAKGLFTVVTGLPGSGKSTFLDVMCYNIAKLHDWKFTFASFETLPLQRHILNFAQIATQKPTFKFIEGAATDAEMEEVRSFLDSHFHFIMPNDNELSIDALLGYVADDIAEHDIDGFILDPYTELDEKRGYGITETEHIKQVLKSFQRFTRHNKIHSWLIAHPVKSSETYVDGRPSLRSIAGSQNFYNKVDFGLVVHRVENQTKVFVDKVRFEINGKVGECAFDFDPMQKSYFSADGEMAQEASAGWRY